MAGSGDEVAAILSASTGGSANLVYVAVFGRRDDGRPTPAVAALVGDRIKVHAMSIAERRVTLDIVEAGPGDPACCPSRLARKSYILQGAALVPVASTAGGNVSLAESAGTEGRASTIGRFRWAPGRRRSSSGMQRVGFRRLQPVHRGSKRVGTLSVGALATTKMACAAPAMDVEDRYLAALARSRSARRRRLQRRTQHLTDPDLRARRAEVNAGRASGGEGGIS